MRAICLFPLFIAFCFACHAKEIHVKADGTGDNATIQSAADDASAGDTIIVHAGTYEERVTVQSSGKVNSPIVFRADPSRSVKMQGFNLKGAYLSVDGFDISSDAHGMDGCGVCVYGDGDAVKNCLIHDMNEKGIMGYWKQPWPKDVAIQNNSVVKCNAGINAMGDGWLVENNQVERLIQHTPKMDCDYLRIYGDGVVVRGNRFSGTKKEEVGNAHVDGIQTYDSNGEYLTNALFERNVIMDCHQGVMAEGRKGGMHDITFRENVFARCWAWGMDLHGIKSLTIESNLFADMSQHGIGFRPGSNGTISRNIFWRAGSVYFADKGAEMSGSENVVYQGSARTQLFPKDRSANPHLEKDYTLTSASPSTAGPQWFRASESEKAPAKQDGL